MNVPYSYDPYADRNWTSGQDGFPGIGQPPFAGPPAEVGTTTVLPAPAQPSSTGLPFKLPFNISAQNLNDLKAMVDRMGGIDGILATAGKVQKFMSTVQQMAPFIKLFMKKGSSSTSEGVSTPRPRRRRTTKRKPATSRRAAGKRR